MVGVVKSRSAVKVRHETPADLGGDHELLARFRGEKRPEAAFGQPEAVVRRGVEVADAALPSRFQHGVRLLVAHRRVEVPEIRRAEREPSERRASHGCTP
jgi:hypothetical protein